MLLQILAHTAQALNLSGTEFSTLTYPYEFGRIDAYLCVGA